MNILFLFFSLFQFTIQDSFLIQEEEVQTYYVEETQHYQVKELGKTRILYYNHLLVVEFTDVNTLHILENNHQATIFVHQEQNIYIYAYQGTTLLYCKMLPCQYQYEFGICWMGNEILFVGGLLVNEAGYFDCLPDQQKENGIILLLDQNGEIIQSRIYGGYQNDRFIKVKEKQGMILIWGWKEYLTGGDLGNAGNLPINHFLLKLDSSFQKVQLQVFSETRIITYDFSDHYIFCCTNKRIYLMDYDLNPLKSLLFPSQSNFAHLTSHNLCIVAVYEKLIIYDLLFFTKIFECDFNSNFTRVTYGLDGIFLHKNDITRLNIFDLRFFQNRINYDYLEKQIVYDLFDQVECHVNEISPHFDLQIHGDYQVNYSCKNVELFAELTIEEKCNVSESLIYPLGYYLDFNGVAYLNNQLIAKNHRLMEEGVQQLTLVNCNGNTKTIQFVVDSKQFFFQEQNYLFFDQVVAANQPFFLTFVPPPNASIHAALINGSWEPVIEQNKEIQIQQNPSNSGLQHITIEALKVSVDEKETVIPYYQSYQIMVLSPSSEISFQIKEENTNFQIRTNILDSYYTLRGFSIRLHGPEEISEQFQPLGEKKWVFHGLESNTNYLMEIFFISEMGDKTLVYAPLINLQIKPSNSTYQVGEIRILKSSQYLEELQLIINKKEVEKLSDQQRVLFQREEQPIAIWIGSGMVFSLSGCVIYYVIRKKRRVSC